jgi:hypothetical protein
VSVTFDETSTGKLSGTWEGTFTSDDPFPLKGSIKSDGDLKVTFDDADKTVPHCHLSPVGMLVSATEIKGTYKVENCIKAAKGDHGTFDVSN